MHEALDHPIGVITSRRAWSGLVGLHFSTGGLVCKLDTTLPQCVPIRDLSTGGPQQAINLVIVVRNL